MTLDALWTLTLETYGGLPFVLAVNFLQVAAGIWTIRQVMAARREREGGLDPEQLRLSALARADVWRNRVRPVVMTMMPLGPAAGIFLSTLLGAHGMAALSDAMAAGGAQLALMDVVADAYRDIVSAYYLMVAGAPPMLLGPAIVLLAHRFDKDEQDALGGDPEDRLIHAIDTLTDALERQAIRADESAARTERMLEVLARRVRA